MFKGLGLFYIFLFFNCCPFVVLNGILLIFSHLKGKSAIDLAVPDSPLTNLLVRYSKDLINSMSPKAPLEINGNVNGQSYRVGPAGPASPGTESALSVDEVNPHWHHSKVRLKMP